MPKSWYTVRAEADATVHVSIRGLIGEWGVTDRDFIREIEAAGDADLISLHINSRGGEVDHGLAIYNYLRAHRAAVRVEVDGIAASAASIIAMSGDEIVMPANALLMLHYPWTFAMGNADELEKVAEDLRKFESALIDTYVARTGKGQAEVRDLLAAETWLTAAEAKDMGFADTVIPLKQTAAVAMAEALDVPESVMAALQAMDPDPAPVLEPDPDPEPVAEPQPSHEDAAAIAGLCHEHGLGGFAAAWIQEGITAAEAGQRILTAKAIADAERPTNPVIQPAAVADGAGVWDRILNPASRGA